MTTSMRSCLPEQTVQCLEQVMNSYPALKAEAKGKTGEDLQAAIDARRG